MKKITLIILAVLGILFIGGKNQRAYAMSFHSSPHTSFHSSVHSSTRVGRSTFKSPSRSGSSIKSGSSYKGTVKSSNTPKVATPKTSSKTTTPKVKSNSNFKGKPIKNATVPSNVKPHSSQSLGFNETNYRPAYESSFSSPRFWMWYWMFNHHDYKDSKGVIHKTSKFNWLKVILLFLLVSSFLLMIILIIYAILL